MDCQSTSRRIRVGCPDLVDLDADGLVERKVTFVGLAQSHRILAVPAADESAERRAAAAPDDVAAWLADHGRPVPSRWSCASPTPIPGTAWN